MMTDDQIWKFFCKQTENVKVLLVGKWWLQYHSVCGSFLQIMFTRTYYFFFLNTALYKRHGHLNFLPRFCFNLCNVVSQLKCTFYMNICAFLPRFSTTMQDCRCCLRSFLHLNLFLQWILYDFFTYTCLSVISIHRHFLRSGVV